MRLQPGVNWLGMISNGRFLWTRQLIFGFHNKSGISGTAERPSTLQGRHRIVELITSGITYSFVCEVKGINFIFKITSNESSVQEFLLHNHRCQNLKYSYYESSTVRITVPWAGLSIKERERSDWEVDLSWNVSSLTNQGVPGSRLDLHISYSALSI
jgi:hypothetical protein